tara:strand:- start:349 stop:921 length:573 start_codon:yes stop_codon:yes gene_type:complete
MNKNELQDKIKNLQDTYYQNNKKNTFFKNKQKYDCAETITQQVNIDTLLQNTLFFIHNSNHLFFHYPTFKTFANPNNFENIVHYFINICFEKLKSYDKILLHVNWKGYTISSHQRYVDLYTLFINIGRIRNFELENILDRLLVYNPPAMMEQITNLFRPIIAPAIINKIELVDKKNSDDEIQNLFDSLKN